MSRARPADLPLSPEDQAAIDRFIDQLWLERGASTNTQASYRSDLRLLARLAEPVALVGDHLVAGAFLDE